MTAKTNANRLSGSAFEALLQHRAQATGHLCIKNPLAYRRLGQNRAIGVYAELDFTLANNLGQVAFVDAKVLHRKTVARTQFVRHQVLRAYRYNLWRVPSGFVVFYARLEQVVFYSGLQLYAMAPQTSLSPADGVLLGPPNFFEISAVFKANSNFLIRSAC